MHDIYIVDDPEQNRVLRDFLDEFDGYSDYNDRVEAVMEEFGFSRDDAESAVWVYENTADEDSDRYEKVRSKSVPDSDGFYTDYTWYYDTYEDRHVFVFGDDDIYRPEDGNFDWECDSEDEAEEWFDSFGEEDIDEALQEFLSDPNSIIDPEDYDLYAPRNDWADYGYEDKFYIVSYFDRDKRGIDDDLWTSDVDRAIEFTFDMLLRGGYVVVTNCMTGEKVEFGDDYEDREDPEAVSDTLQRFLGESLKEGDEWYTQVHAPKSEVIAWLQDHKQAWKDITNHFKVKSLDYIGLDQIEEWIHEHDQLAQDFESYFSEKPKQKDESLKESMDVNALVYPIIVKKDYEYDRLENMDEDEIQAFTELGLIVTADKGIIPKGTRLKYEGNYGRQLLFSVMNTDYDWLLSFNNMDGMFERDFDEYFEVEKPLKESSKKQSYKVTYGFDAGNGESGPLVQTDSIIIQATSKEEACHKFEASLGDDDFGYCGCTAELIVDKSLKEAWGGSLKDEIADIVASVDAKGATRQYRDIYDRWIIDTSASYSREEAEQLCNDLRQRLAKYGDLIQDVTYFWSDSDDDHPMRVAVTLRHGDYTRDEAREFIEDKVNFDYYGCPEEMREYAEQLLDEYDSGNSLYNQNTLKHIRVLLHQFGKDWKRKNNS